MSLVGGTMNKGEQTKELILDTATELFAKQGYLGVTMQNICDHTGLSRGGLYRHFDSCETIFSHIITRMCKTQYLDIQAKLQAQLSPTILVNELFQRYEQELNETHSSLSLAICEYYREAQDEQMKQAHEQARQMWRLLIQYGITQNEFHEVDIETFIDRWLFSYQGLRLWQHMIPIQESAKRIIEQTKMELII